MERYRWLQNLPCYYSSLQTGWTTSSWTVEKEPGWNVSVHILSFDQNTRQSGSLPFQKGDGSQLRAYSMQPVKKAGVIGSLPGLLKHPGKCVIKV